MRLGRDLAAMKQFLTDFYPAFFQTIFFLFLSSGRGGSTLVVNYTVFDNRMIKRQYYEICKEMICKNVKLNQAKCHKKRQNSVQMCSKPNLRPQIFLVKRLHSFPQNLNAKNCMISFPFILTSNAEFERSQLGPFIVLNVLRL